MSLTYGVLASSLLLGKVRPRNLVGPKDKFAPRQYQCDLRVICMTEYNCIECKKKELVNPLK